MDAQCLSASAVLGITGRKSAEWLRLRSLQHAALVKQTGFRAYANAVFALFVARIFMDSVSLNLMRGWALAIGIVQVRAVQTAVDLSDIEKSGISSAEFGHHVLSSIMTAALWAVPVLVFAPMGSTADLTALLVIYAILICGGVFFNTSAPLATAGFTLVLGIATMISLAAAGLWLVLAAVAVFVIMTVLGTAEIGRVRLAARLAADDATEQRETVSLLLREFEENEADWLWEVDITRRLRSVSPRFAFALGHAQRDAEGKPLLELISGSWDEGDIDRSLHELAERLKNRENFSALIVRVTIKGEKRWWELSGTPIHDDRGRFAGFRGVGSDVTEQRASSEKIAYLARYDTLTSLPNRLQLNEALGEAIKYAEKWRSRCALLMIDLDRFKSVNDSLGHLVGDKLLAQVSARLRNILSEDQLCGRLGGDEFAIVIRDADSKEIVNETARKVISTLSEPYEVGHHTLYVGASVGSAMGLRDGNTVEELMRNADLALYQAKDLGGGEHCRFEPSLHALAEERRKLEVSLRRAVLEEEFVLHYQPVVDARTEEIVSFEALVRWNSPEHGFVSPGKFIPLAEDTRLIVPIGRWVLRQACVEARAWPDSIKVNVNVSPEQLLEPRFHEEVIDALSSSGLRPERLEVEVTESIFVRDAATARRSLEKIMALGCSVALDDFGTGYSSLGYLRTLRFSTIKVDRSFVQGAAQNSNESLAIINAVVAMARSLDMTTTAEGVESAEEAEMIRKLGCDKIQGYYFGRPMPQEDARRIFQTEKWRLRAG